MRKWDIARGGRKSEKREARRRERNSTARASQAVRVIDSLAPLVGQLQKHIYRPFCCDGTIDVWTALFNSSLFTFFFFSQFFISNNNPLHLDVVNVAMRDPLYIKMSYNDLFERSDQLYSAYSKFIDDKIHL